MKDITLVCKWEKAAQVCETILDTYTYMWNTHKEERHTATTIGAVLTKQGVLFDIIQEGELLYYKIYMPYRAFYRTGTVEKIIAIGKQYTSVIVSDDGYNILDNYNIDELVID